ncbi:enterobactin synthetase [Streptomyces sp. NPDC057806]|uniref:enterobactin synthetase n=1 Tax=Streptomyces sp. NPDC057806 TaxID=3346255 RepID=UPI0036BECDFC
MTARPALTEPAGTETSCPARNGRESLRAAGGEAGQAPGNAPGRTAGRGPAGAADDEYAGAAGGEVTALRPLLAAAGLGLGVAAVCEPGPEPAGPAEAAAAASMPPKRRLEFLAGRRAARRALRAVGLECGEIPRSGRLPVFPPGQAASISHSAGIAVAVARAPGLDLPLGCDLELRPLPRGAARLVLRADEEALLGAGAQAWSVTDLFSAKEAAWKALVGPDGEHPAGPVGSLRGLRVRPDGDGLRVCLRAAPAHAVRVRVVRVGAGVFSYVAGRADAHG